MKQLLPALLLLLAAVAAGQPAGSQPVPQPAPQPRGCGFIAEVAGKVVLERDGKYYLLKGMEGLNCGETVRVLKGARAVYAECADNLKFEIPGPAIFTITAGKPAMKSGPMPAGVKVDPALCPFFLEQAVKRLKLPRVDADGNLPERQGSEIIYKPLEEYIFNGYLTEVKGEVYVSGPDVLRLTGELVPNEGMQVLTRRGSVAVMSCGEGRKYKLSGASLIRFNEIGKTPRVEFLRGQASAVEEINVEACYARRELILNNRGKSNTRATGIDGN